MYNMLERLEEPTEVFRRMMESFGGSFRVACPGIIQSFNATRQTVTVQLAIRDKININGNLSWENIPLLVDVPVFLPRAGGYVLTMPISAGDECLVIFGDMCIDAWWQSGGVQNQPDRRRHDLSDGFALVGVWSQPNVISGYSGTTAQLRNEAGTAYVEIAGDEVHLVGSKVVINGRTFLEHTHVEPDGATGVVI